MLYFSIAIFGSISAMQGAGRDGKTFIDQDRWVCNSATGVQYGMRVSVGDAAGSSSALPQAHRPSSAAGSGARPQRRSASSAALSGVAAATADGDRFASPGRDARSTPIAGVSGGNAEMRQQRGAGVVLDPLPAFASGPGIRAVRALGGSASSSALGRPESAGAIRPKQPEGKRPSRALEPTPPATEPSFPLANAPISRVVWAEDSDLGAQPGRPPAGSGLRAVKELRNQVREVENASEAMEQGHSIFTRRNLTQTLIPLMQQDLAVTDLPEPEQALEISPRSSSGATVVEPKGYLDVASNAGREIEAKQIITSAEEQIYVQQEAPVVAATAQLQEEDVPEHVRRRRNSDVALSGGSVRGTVQSAPRPQSATGRYDSQTHPQSMLQEPNLNDITLQEATRRDFEQWLSSPDGIAAQEAAQEDFARRQGRNAGQNRRTSWQQRGVATVAENSRIMSSEERQSAHQAIQQNAQRFLQLQQKSAQRIYSGEQIQKIWTQPAAVPVEPANPTPARGQMPGSSTDQPAEMVAAEQSRTQMMVREILENWLEHQSVWKKRESNPILEVLLRQVDYESVEQLIERTSRSIIKSLSKEDYEMFTNGDGRNFFILLEMMKIKDEKYKTLLHFSQFIEYFEYIRISFISYISLLQGNIQDNIMLEILEKLRNAGIAQHIYEAPQEPEEDYEWYFDLFRPENLFN